MLPLQQLANYFERQPTTWRVLEELPWHWCQAHHWDKLHHIVRTPQYFQLFRSSSEINQFNTFKIDLFRYWDDMKQHSNHLPSEVYNVHVQCTCIMCNVYCMIYNIHCISYCMYDIQYTYIIHNTHVSIYRYGAVSAKLFFYRAANPGGMGDTSPQ